MGWRFSSVKVVIKDGVVHDVQAVMRFLGNDYVWSLASLDEQLPTETGEIQITLDQAGDSVCAMFERRGTPRQAIVQFDSRADIVSLSEKGLFGFKPFVG